MRSIILALVASTIAIDVTVTWRHEKSTGGTSLTVEDAKTDSVLAESCGSQVGSLSFSNVDENGAGNFSVGDNTFSVRRNANGASCTRVFDGNIATVECSGISFDVPEGLAKSADCFQDEHAKASFIALHRRNLVPDGPTPILERATTASSAKFRGRQQCHEQSTTAKVGDGNPHQNFFHKQISENINCGASPSCVAGYEVSKSYTIGWSASISLDGWISGGFDVQKSWETGNDYQCYGGSGDEVCVWYNTAHTAYTAKTYYSNTCLNNERSTDPFVISSPNKNNRNGGYYCVVGTCRAQGDAYWDRTGRAGGP